MNWCCTEVQGEVYIIRLTFLCEVLGTVRSTTVTAMKMPPQNITLLCFKSFVIVPSSSRPTIWVKYCENKLVPAVSVSRAESCISRRKFIVVFQYHLHRARDR